MAIKMSSWYGSWTTIWPSSVARMVPGPGNGHQKLEWVLDQDIAIKSSWNGSWYRILPSIVAGMIPGP